MNNKIKKLLSNTFYHWNERRRFKFILKQILDELKK